MPYSLPSAVRIALLRAARGADVAERPSHTHRLVRATWRSGVSVLIPERGTPHLLARALRHLQVALAPVCEPVEVVVLVNGAPAGAYATMAREHPAVRWDHSAAPLGFSGALARGLALCRLGGIYLHNSDMALEPEAIAALLPWRAAQVFAIASQIYFDDPAKRREETGWGALRREGDRSVLYDRTPEPDRMVRSGLYAGGGSSLFDAQLLRRFSAITSGYAPFYWEDADWGVQAWRNGLIVLFHPGSVAWHRHRATIAANYDASEIDRVVARNAVLFDLRNAPGAGRALRDASRLNPVSLRELSSPGRLWELRRARRALRRSPFPHVDIERTCERRYLRSSPPDGRPLVLVVTPFRILPPLHGGAWRIWHLCQGLRHRFRFVLISDEATGHGPEAWARLGGLERPEAERGPFDSVHLVGGRPPEPADRIGRMQAHSHPALQAELDYVTAVYRPAIVQLENVELAMLRPPRGAASVLVAHDVLLGGDHAADAAERAALARFDAVIACSAEDARLLHPAPHHVVPNGAVIDRAYCPSPATRRLLFAGPFRYAPNREGLLAFLADTWPELRRSFPDVELVVLAGEGGLASAAGEPLLQQRGVTVLEAVEDVRTWLENCSLTINPQREIRGSSVKLIESLAAGRACVSTRDGARGFADAGLPGLILAEDIAGMAAPIARLLADGALRHDLEIPDPVRLAPFSWKVAAERLGSVYDSLLAGRDVVA